jgi:UPF0755 protein
VPVVKLRFAASVAAAILAAVLFAAWLHLPYRGFAASEVFVEIPRGTGTLSMGRQLASAGVLRYGWQLALARLANPHAPLQAGEYRFAEPASPIDIFHRLARGDVYYRQLTIPEGADIFDIAEIAGRLGVVSPARFLAAASNPGLIRDLDPRALSLEGYLFPSTYRIGRHATGQELCRMMTAQFRREWRALAPSSGANVHDTVILASLVEKETADPEERRLVAGVFRNRLKKGMFLDCDPTTIYAALLDERYRGVIHRSDLASRNAYNTYTHAGLPPGPIANPGVASLEAALDPAKTDYLYFVAKPDGGGHHFSRTIEEHNRRVHEYRHANR